MVANEYLVVEQDEVFQEMALNRLEGGNQTLQQATLDQIKLEKKRKKREAVYAACRTRELRPKASEVFAKQAIADDNLLHMVYVEGMTYEAIGALYGVGKTAIFMRMQQKLKKLRKEIEA